MTRNKCAFAGCDDAGTLKRQSHRNGEIYRYCPDHDPLESDAAFGFKEVGDGD